MNLVITVKDWRFMVDKETKQKKIAGRYLVKAGQMTVAEADFNDGYNATTINIPAELMVEVEALDAKIREAIIKHFTD